MRFGLDGSPLRAKKTGIGHYTFELARALAAIAPYDDVEVVSPSSFFQIDSASQLLTPNLRFVGAGLNGVRRRSWWSIGLPLYCRQASFALFHGTNFDLPYWSNCPTVLTIHDLSLLLYPQTHKKHLVRRARLKLPYMARKADAIITPCESVKRDVCQNLGVNAEKVFAIPEAARDDFYPVHSAESRTVCERLGIESEFILFVGTVEPRKNLLTLARAFDELIRTTGCQPQLVIAGDEGWLSNDLTSYIDQSPARERIRFTGHLADDDLRALYSACRVFVYPSLYEGFGLPLLEAMSCGAPVITSKVPGIIETVGDVARLVSPTDSGELARAISCLFEDANERERRSEAGLQHVKNFSWSRTAAATLKVYHKVIGARHK